jgi:hypothetical protein
VTGTRTLLPLLRLRLTPYYLGGSLLARGTAPTSGTLRPVGFTTAPEPARAYFRTLWDAVKGSTNGVVNDFAVTKASGLSGEDGAAADEWLRKQGWIREAGLGGEIQLTDEGVRAGQRLF